VSTKLAITLPVGGDIDRAGVLGGVILPIDTVFEFIAREPLFWNLTYRKTNHFWTKLS
jgi:hypothetical protein